MLRGFVISSVAVMAFLFIASCIEHCMRGPMRAHYEKGWSRAY